LPEHRFYSNFFQPLYQETKKGAPVLSTLQALFLDIRAEVHIGIKMFKIAI
jgi:DNA-dependent RNA polymerase auxiliary subunit epsilon